MAIRREHPLKGQSRFLSRVNNGRAQMTREMNSMFDKHISSGSLTYCFGETMTPDMKGDFTEVVNRIREEQDNENPNLIKMSERWWS